MQFSENTTGPFSVKLALLTAAVGAGFAGPAQAAYISTAGTGFTPVVFDLSKNNASFAIDLDQNGSTDFTLSSTTGNSVVFQGSGNNAIDSYTGYYPDAYASTSQFVSAGSIKASTSVTLLDTNGGNALSVPYPYAELVFSDAHNASLVGYIRGTGVSAGAASTFTLTDYGYDSPISAVPEPSSLALFAAGAAGLGVLRLRRRRQAERSV